MSEPASLKADGSGAGNTREVPSAVAELDRKARRVGTRSADVCTVWRLWGAGDPVVLLHGGFGSWTHWLRNIEPLAAHHSVMVPDMPGFGDSDTIEGEPDAAAIAGHLWHGLDRLAGRETPVTLAGFSFGGAIAGTMAALQPDRTRRLVLVGSGGMRATRGPVGELVRWRDAGDEAAVQAAHRRNLEILMFRDPSRIDSLAVALAGREHPPHAGQEPADLAGRRSRCCARRLWRCGRHMGRVRRHRRRSLSRAGGHPPPVDPRSQFIVIEGAGHWVQFEAADRFNETMIGLLRDDPGHGSGLRAGQAPGETKHVGGMP